MSFSPPLRSRNLFQFQLQKLIPRAWKQNITNPPTYVSQISVADSESLPEDFPTEEEPLLDSLQLSLKSFTSQGHLSEAFKTFSLIQLHYSALDFLLHPVSSLLLSCIKLKTLPQGKQVHAFIISLGVEQSSLLVPKLVTFYSTFGHLSDAHFIAENSNIFHALTWNVLISVYIRNGLHGEALSAFKQMVHMGIKPDNFTYPSVLKACSEKFDLEFGREVHKAINASHMEWSLYVQNALISMYAKCGEVGIARRLFEEMPERDAVSWNSMISGYAFKGMWDEAFLLFERMRRGDIDANIVTWNTIAGGCLQTGNYKGALELVSQMKSHGACLDSVAMIIALGACSRIGFVKYGKEVHGSIVRSCCDGVESVKNALITMYSRCKDPRHAYLMFRSIKAKSVITWNSMIAGYSHSDRYEEAAFVFREMLVSGVEPNYVTIASILPLCARLANLQHGKEFHCFIIRHGGFKDYLLLWNALVDMYSKSGKISEAQNLFNSMSERDEVSYTSLIDGYGMQGQGYTALNLFEEMNSFKIKPDHVTMVAVLSACSHSGLVSQGQLLFEKMINCYGVNPRMEHFACMVDLFGRAGLLRKAEDIIRRMPYSPSPAMWATLLGSCRIHGNIEIGEWAAEKLLEMRPENSGYYILIANMYAAAGSWSKLAKVRTFMRDLGVRKTTGCAWVDVGNGFHPFSVEDRSNPHAQEIYLLLERLSKLMKEDGYVAIDDLEE